MSGKYLMAGAVLLALGAGAIGAFRVVEESRWRHIEVTATAYNSLPAQTTATDHDLAAWGDRLRPGMRAIAVSRDLLAEGLGHGSIVRIEGLEGDWLVLDKMHRRWNRRIDIYMGTDVQAAREWGRRQVTIRWRPDDPE